MFTQTAKLPPGPKENVLFSSQGDILGNLLFFLEKNMRQYPGISRMRVGPFWYLHITEPDYIEQVLLDRDTFAKGRDNENLKFLLGNGLLTSEGDFWLKQRRLIQPLFHKQRLESFVQKMNEQAQLLIQEWRTLPNPAVDMHNEMMKVTLRIVSSTLLSSPVTGDFRTVSDALWYLMEGMVKRTRNFIRLPYWIPLPRHQRMKQNRQILDNTILAIINKRRSEKGNFDDLLTMLMEVEDADTAERMTDRQLRDEIITIYLAGYETTANALSFTFYLLAKHPDIKERVAAEVKSVTGGSQLRYEDLPRLDYTGRVIKEAMRLYPPAYGILRQAMKDTVIDGYIIKRGDNIVMSPYAVQRWERFWENPTQFDPDRFLPERMKDKPRYAYFPFGGGARLCIGNNFAMMEMQIILASVCGLFDFTVEEGFAPELEALVTLRPGKGMPLKITPAKNR